MIIEKSIKDLVFAEYNPRQVSKTAIDRLKKSLSSPQGKELFKRRPILVNNREGKLVVYAGNMRLRAAMALGMKEVPCIVDEISLEEEKERNIKDNLVIGEWDDDLLANNFEIEQLEDWGVDLKELGIERVGEEETDEVPEPPKEARAERGKIYTLGKHRVMCGDSANAGDVSLLMDGKKADMVFTDPPYGVGYEKKAQMLGRSEYSKVSGDESLNESCAIWGEAFKNIDESLKDDGSYYVCAPQGGDQMMMMMMMMMKNHIPCRHELIWVKPSPVFSMGRLDYDYQHEPILYGWKKKHNFRGKGQHTKSIWNIGRDSGKLHPTMKPVELMVNAIQNSSDVDSLVIDFFSGSGSTLIACEQTGRICYGMEIDPKYVDVIIERYCNYAKCDKEEIYNSAVSVVQEEAEVGKG